MSTDNANSQAVFDRARDAFSRLSPGAYAAVDDLVSLYDDQVVFQDPLQRVEGRDGFAAMNRRLLNRARVLTVRLGEGIAAGDVMFFTWEMDYAFKLGPTATIEGATHLRQRDGRIIYHRDYWDALSGAIGTVPGVRRIYRTVAAHIA